MGVSKLPRSRYQITSFFGNKSTVEGKDIKNPTSRAQYQAFATPYSATPAGKTASAKVAGADSANLQKRSAQITSAAESRVASRTAAVNRLKKSQVSQSQRYPSAPASRGMAPQQKAAEARDARPVARPSMASANTRKEDYPLKKGSTQPPAYQGVKGDSATKRGAVTSYQANGYTYTKNAQGNYQNFKAGPMPSKKKGSDR